jgi:TonB-dependent receptor
MTDTETPVAGSKRKGHLLPGIHSHYRSPDSIHSTDAWSWGAAYTQSLGRPGFEETKAGLFIEDDHVELGNPSLNPLHSQNFDLSVAYERPALGQFEAAIFHKSIADFIYVNRRNFDFNRDGEIDEVREFSNGRAGRISGIEFTYHNTLWGAPHTDRRLDFTTSATFVDSEATYFDVTWPQPERKLPFIKQSDKLFRADLEWYHRAWRFRLSDHYRSGFLDELGEGSDDFEVLDYGQLDVAIGYQPTRDYSLYLRLENLTQEPFRARWISSKRVAEFEDLGINPSLGITWTH